MKRLHGTGISVVLAASALLSANAALADPVKTIDTLRVKVKIETIASGLDHPWAVEVLPDGAYLVTERPGQMRVIRDGKKSVPIAGMPDVYARGQGGLLDVALDPKFAGNRTVYFTASIATDSGNGTAVFRAVLSPDERRLTDVKRIFLMNKLSRGSIQYGSRIAIAKDGSLFVSLGDRGQQNRAQDFHDDAGSIIHIGADSSIPADNPFRDGVRALPEIWSKGHRNPQGIAFDTADGKLYTAEHGARGGMRSTHQRRARTTAGLSFPTDAIIPAPRSASVQQKKAWSSRSSIGIRRSHPAPSPSIAVGCSRSGGAISSSPR